MELSTLNAIGMFPAFILLFFGRKFYWLFVGVAGFLYGSGMAAQLFPTLPDMNVAIIGMVLGSVCAFIAHYFVRVLVAIGGCIAGSYIALWLFMQLTPFGAGGVWTTHFAGGIWTLYLAGGILGAVLSWMALDETLIVLSTLLGAVLLTEALSLPMIIGPLVGLVAFAAGLAFQLKHYHSHAEPPPAHPVTHQHPLRREHSTRP